MSVCYLCIHVHEQHVPHLQQETTYSLKLRLEDFQEMLLGVHQQLYHSKSYISF